MKKIIILSIFSALLFAMVIGPAVVSAELVVPTAADVKTDVAPPTNSVEDAINNFTNWFFVIVLVVAVIFLLIAGFQFITAGGEPDKVNAARQNVMYAMIGVAVAILAKGLVGLVMGIAGGGE